MNEKLEEGTPSAGLRGLSIEEGGILDTSEAPESVTEAVPERGIYRIVGGYMDRDGVIHNEVELRAMTGHEEDLLGNTSMSVVPRMNGILSQCCVRFGTLTDRGDIVRAVQALPSGSRTHMLILLRVTSHWHTEKDRYDMEMQCPDEACRHRGFYSLRLLEMDTFDWPEPGVTEVTTDLRAANIRVRWKFLDARADHFLSVLGSASEAEFLTYAIVVRLLEWDGVNVGLTENDLLDSSGRKMRLNRRAKELILRVKNLSSEDREALRASFLEHEPGVDTDLELDCEKCGSEFTGRLDVTQRSFFFPRATSARSKRRRTT